jgi:transposase
MEVLIGVDPHKATNAAVAIDEHGDLVGQATFPANRGGIRALERWAKRFAERRWAIEGATGIGRPLAQKLAASGEEVVDVPPKLSAKVRVLSTGNARKRTTAWTPPSPRWPPCATSGSPGSIPRTGWKAASRS